MTHKLYINAYFIISFAFPVNNSKLSNFKKLLAILTDRQQPEKNTLIMIIRSRRRSRTFAKDRAGCGMECVS